MTVILRLKPSLGSGETDALGRVHGLEHVVDELAQIGGAEFLNIRALALKDGVAIFHYLVDHRTFNQ